MKKIKQIDLNTSLHADTVIKARFGEVDSMRVVWHGNYAKYFEDGREAFGKKYGLSYMEVYEQGYMIPLVKLEIDYKNSLAYDQEAILTTIFKDNDAAKIEFFYVLKRKSDGLLIAQGHSIQVFLDANSKLQLLNPDFFIKWKKRHLPL